MARGTTLAILINDLRSEIGHSLQPNLGKSTRDVMLMFCKEHKGVCGKITAGHF